MAFSSVVLVALSAGLVAATCSSYVACGYGHAYGGCSNGATRGCSYVVACPNYQACSPASSGSYSSCNYAISPGQVYNCINPGSTSSYCSVSNCAAGTANCNGQPGDACEVNTNTNVNNCGACGHVCLSGQVCQSGSCAYPTDFSVAANPSSGIVNAGDTKVTNVTVSLVSGVSLPVSLSASNLPSGASVLFSPVSCAPNCYSNMTITTTGSTPVWSGLISVSGAYNSLVRSGTYNLTVLTSNVAATCGNHVCNYPETQTTCPVDCNTTTVIPSPVGPGQVVAISVEFWDFRYQAGQPVQIDLTLNPGSTAWTPSNGCFFGGKKMASSSGSGAVAWPAGTVSQDGHFKISTSCTLPATITAGPHTLVATPTIF